MAGRDDEERLPWLESYNERKPAKTAPVKRSSGGLWVGAGALGLMAAAGAGILIGQRQPQPSMADAEIALAPTPPHSVARSG